MISVAILSALRDKANQAKTSAGAYLHNESGGIAIFTLVIFTFMLVVGGMAVDFQRHESARADLQDALDRATLAAANLNQQIVQDGVQDSDSDVYALVSGYMLSRSQKHDDLSVNISVAPIPGGRRVAASANLTLPTIFLSLVGVDTLKVNASSTATEAISQLEVTLVLDVTGSMGSTSQSGLRKIDDLKIAAKTFLDTILSDPNAPVLVSILPFSQNVNMPADVIGQFNVTTHHTHHNCLDFDSFDFTTLPMPLNPTTAYLQAQHFHSYESERYHCPRSDNMATVFSDDLTELKATIDRLTTETYTAMFMGMRWAAALNDPAARPIVASKVSSSQISGKFAGWPANWTDGATRKIVVLMSDGRNTYLREVPDETYAAQPVDYWAAEYRESDIEVRAWPADGDTMLAQTCAALKQNPNVVVYTIGFEVNDNASAQQALLGCATNVSTYYLVEGVEISAAFKNIADEVVKLKLVN